MRAATSGRKVTMESRLSMGVSQPPARSVTQVTRITIPSTMAKA